MKRKFTPCKKKIEYVKKVILCLSGLLVQYDTNNIVQKYRWVKKDKLQKVKVVQLNLIY